MLTPPPPQRFVESQGDGNGLTGDMTCVTVANPVGACGGIPSKGQPNCAQPVSGQAPPPSNLACLNGIIDYAIQLAQGLCAA